MVVWQGDHVTNYVTCVNSGKSNTTHEASTLFEDERVSMLAKVAERDQLGSRHATYLVCYRRFAVDIERHGSTMKACVEGALHKADL